MENPCSICAGPIGTKEPAALFLGTSGDAKEICLECESKMDALEQGQNPEAVKDAIDSFYTYSRYTTDREVAAYLKEIVESNAREFKREAAQKAAAARPGEMRDYFAETAEKEAAPAASLWITALKAVAWVAFFSVIIVGIVVAAGFARADSGFLAFIVIVVSFAMAVLSVAGVMVYLNMAADVSAIRSLLERKDGRDA